MANATRPKTPPRKPTQLVTPDTVPISRGTSQSGYRSGDLKLGRQAVLSDLQRVLTVPFELLKKRIVPDDTLDKNYIAGIRTRLEEQGLLVSDEQGIHWKAFKTRPATSKSEVKTFASLTPIINSISSQQPSCVVDYVDNPSGTPLSSRNNTSRPDGYLKLLNTKTVESTETGGSTRTHWFDIAVPFEFKLKSRPDVDTLDNEHKIIWSLHNIMREDPCRRFAYGITIEDTNMRLWLTNRSCLVVTEPINFLEDVDDFIFLFSALGAATDVALGWDPTIERIFDKDNKNPTQYRIKVNDNVYTTTDEIATYGADSLVGRGTRVYKAQDAQGNVVAIKDFWKDIDRLAEGEIIAEILKAIQDKFPTEAEEATKYFISVKEFGDVIVCGREDYTVDFTEHAEGSGLPKGCQWRAIIVTMAPSMKPHANSTGNVPDSENRSQVGRHTRRQPLNGPIPRKVHHRTVFHDVGTALQDMLNLKDIIACLRDTLKGLYYMHRVGWIHRDYSIGNALRVVKDGQSIGKLSDFEYAKSITSEISHDVRTGTIHFMAWEVDQQSYEFTSPDAFPKPLRKRDMPQGTSRIAQPQPPFRMNFLHDLESVFWAFSWSLLYNTDKINPPADLDAQCTEYENAFPGFLSRPSRQKFLTQSKVIHQAFETLSSTCQDAAVVILPFAHDLVDAYRRAESSYPHINIPDDDLEGIHNKARAHLDEAWEESGEVELIRVHTLYRHSRKRTISGVETSPTPQTQKKLR